MFRVLTAASVFAFAVLPYAVSAKAPAKLPPSKPLVCQGSVATIVENAIAGESRSESQLVFGMKVKAATREALIIGVQGSTVLKPGRYLVSPTEKGFSIDLTWIDRRNQPQYARLRFQPDGTFFRIDQLVGSFDAGP